MLGGDAVDDLVAGLGDSDVLVLFDEVEWALSATALLAEALCPGAVACEWS